MVEGYEDVGTPVGTVLEYLVGRQVPAPDRDARQVRRNQCDGDAAIGVAAEQTVRVVQFERESEHAAHRPESDVALVPVEPDAEDFFTVPLAAADDAAVGHGRGVRAGFGAGQTERGDFLASGESRQPVAALRISAVLQQQLAGAERVRHHHGDRRCDRAGRDHPDDLGMCERREAETTVLARDDHAEELVPLQVLPHRVRQVRLFPGDLPVVEHRAEFLDGPVDECLLVDREPWRRYVEQLLPARIAGEQLRVPPHVACFERCPLGIRQARQHPARPAEQRAGDELPAQRSESSHW